MNVQEVIIETPEKIQFSYSLAEIGTRISAYIVDVIIQIGIIIVFILLLIPIGLSVSSVADSKNFFNFTIAFYYLLSFFLRWFYYVFFESIMQGQTPGKRAMRIRVIKTNGEHLDFETIVLRNLMRVVDSFPGIPLTGGFVAMIDKQNRRLGDIIANTIVVKEMYYKLEEPSFSVEFQNKTDHTLNVSLKNKLNEEDLYIIRRFLNDRKQLPAIKQEQVAMDLAEKVKEKIKIDQKINKPIQFLEQIYKKHGTNN